MVAKSALLLLLLLFAIPLCAVESDLIELITEDLQYDSLSDFYKELSAFIRPLALESSLYLKEEDSYSLHSAIYRSKKDYLLLNTIFNYEDGSTHANFTINLSGKDLVRQVSLGNYRLRFGRGIVFGYGKRGMPSSIYELEKPPRADVYSPFGAAAKLGWKELSLLGFGSAQSRKARLSGEDILSLPTKKTEELGSTLESLYGATLGYEGASFSLAGMAYHQSYDREFSDDAKETALNAFSLYAALSLKRHKIDVESAWQNGKNNSRVVWEMTYGSFKQSFGYAQNPSNQYTAYAISPAVLSKRLSAEELSWDAQIPMLENIVLLTRLSINHVSDLDENYLSRQMAALEYKESGSRVRLSLFRFDREILYEIDDSYQSTIPQNYRAQIVITQKLFPVLTWSAQFRYHFEQKRDYDKNSFFAENALAYAYGKLKTEISWQRWHSLHEFVIPDSQEPDAYALTSGEDSTLSLSGEYTYKGMRFGSAYRQSLLISGNYQLLVRLGASF
ncbi:MAG: hypothetical protein Q8J62_00375 [Candidatus Cloacimonadaceae bacterium]|nr:hypothetical protein [Candidatus Cloacimonadaceae bacterium]